MTVKTSSLKLNTNKNFEIIDITSQINDLIDIDEGIVSIFSKRSTSAIVVNEEGSLKIEIVCKPQEENRFFLFVLCIEAVIFTAFLLFIYGIGNVYVYYPLVIPALGIPLATWVNRQVSLHVARDILQC